MSNTILLYNDTIFIKEYKNNTFINFEEYETYKWLGLHYPYMCL